jgi:hypothetical protein
MQLFTSLSQMDALPASDLKTHLQARHRTLYEDGIGPVFVIVEKTDRIDGPDYAFIGNRGLLSDLYEERAPKEDGFVRPYEWVSHLPELRLYEALYLINGEDGYWIIIPEEIVEAHPDLKWVLTDESQGGLSDPQPFQ